MDSALSSPVASSSKDNMEFSLLLGLPGEIRNKIYEFALGGTHYNVDYPVVGNRQVYATYDNVNDSHEIKKNRLALTRTCRQVYEETKTFHVRLSTYHLNSPHTLYEWSGVLPGAESVVIDRSHFMPLRRLPDTIEDGDIIVEGLPRWDEESTITKIELRITEIEVVFLGYALSNHIPDDSGKAEVMAWGEQWRQDMQNRIKAAKDGVRFSFSIRMKDGNKVFSFPRTG